MNTVFSNNSNSAEQKTPPNTTPESFDKQVDKAMQGKLDRYNALFVCHTPQLLVDLGFKQLPMLYTQKHLKNAIAPQSNQNPHKHGLTVRQIKRIPDMLKEPVMIYRSKTEKDSIVVVTNELDKNNAPIVIAVKMNGKGVYNNKEQTSNFITSVYGKNNRSLSYILDAFETKKMLYVDIEKSQRLLSVLRLQLPQGFNIVDFNRIISHLNSFVNPPIQKNSQEVKKDMSNNQPDTAELIQKLSEQLGKNNELVAQLITKVTALEQQQKMFSSHLNQIYNSKSIEETLSIMGDMGKSDLNAEECSVYSYDRLENKLFTVNGDGERVYTDISEQTAIGAALMKNEVFLENQYNGAMLGDGKDNENTRNVAVIPIEAKSGDVIGVVVAKNKDSDFTKEDIGKFDLENGNIGSAFRMGLENKALQQAAVTDKLTHLHNRQGAQAFLKNTVLQNIHEGKPVSAIMIDIDKFKNFNDTYGHDVGDKVLKQVADILKENVRSGDGVFRWGGEEMVIIANMDGTEAYSLAERLRQSIQNTPLDIGDGKQVQITASMGVAQVVTDTPERLNGENIMQYFESKPLKRADERLYEAKENGRNCVVASAVVMQKAARSEHSEDRRKSSIINGIKDIQKTDLPKPQKDKPPKSKGNYLE